MPLPIALWLFWSSVLGLPSWQPRDTQNDQKSA